MVFIIIKNNHPINTLSPGFDMFVEMFDPFYNRLIVCLAVRRGLDNPREREVAFNILKDEVVDALYDQEQR